MDRTPTLPGIIRGPARVRDRAWSGKERAREGRTKKGAGGHKHRYRSHKYAGLTYCGQVGVAITSDGPRWEGGLACPWPHPGCVCKYCASVFFIPFPSLQERFSRLGYGSARYATDLSAGSVEGFCDFGGRKSYRNKGIDWA